MIRTREIIPASLDHALMATRVLAALKQPASSLASPLLEGALDDAVRFLNDIIQGKRYTTGRTVEERSYECALAYGEAIRAVDLLPPPNAAAAKADLAKFFKECLETARAVSAQRTVSQQSLSDLVAFFKLVRDVTLRVGRQPIETVAVPE